MKLFPMTKRERERVVKRVVVMLDYEDGSPDNGEVFDLTALASELRSKDAKFHDGSVMLEVHAREDYGVRLSAGYGEKKTVSWSVIVGFESSGESGWLDDAVNAGLPDSERTRCLVKRVSKAEKNLEKLRAAVKEQRMLDAADVRGKHPVCRVRAAVGLPHEGSDPPPAGMTNDE